ncbi:carotenoid oxygenase family protein [Nocardia otitidiscaviarum]|uniref:carotenoid oxygenase family protein n=1 Tax=Nocardia otitidiscaviarum TaxID=1823 RepID=UPI0009DF74DB|nr:carotenoid oxygenase family protein [Nocardia otitidiscaviarum]MBF6135652.1 carotenoid oxygenase family protein [Nocardia otitidiscaviarum]MBF6487470.1 carotenoid oxygenase family protein [Nocardia otitidiscaviarum]
MVGTRYRESPFLTGHHRPTRMEVDAPDLFVEGELPDDLAGVFYRNGAEPLYPPTDEDYHWFDGDGMVYAFFFDGRRVSMRNRWVRTDKLLLEMKEGRRLFGVHGNPASTDPLAAGTRYNTANTNVVLHGGKLLALMEGAPPVELDPRSLDTIGEEHYGGVVTTTFGAHPTVDHATGELINIGSIARRGGTAPELRYDIIDSDGTPIVTETVPVPHQSLLHTFFVTENHVVFPVTPLDVSLRRAMAGGPMVAWDPDRPTKLGVMPRRGGADDVRWFEAAPRHMMHQANVWEEDGRIVADVAAAEGTALFPDVDGRRRTHRETRQSLRRWVIDPAAHTDVVREEILNDRDIQFPRPDDRLMTRPSRYAFANSNLHSVDGRADGMDSVVRVDTRTGAEDVYHFGDGAAAGELIFAPRVGATDEVDGYALTLVHAAGAADTELAVFAAGDLASGPLARVRIPFAIPSGFHCNYYSVDSPLYRQALGAR